MRHLRKKYFEVYTRKDKQKRNKSYLIGFTLFILFNA